MSRKLEGTVKEILGTCQVSFFLFYFFFWRKIKPLDYYSPGNRDDGDTFSHCPIVLIQYFSENYKPLLNEHNDIITESYGRVRLKGT